VAGTLRTPCALAGGAFSSGIAGVVTQLVVAIVAVWAVLASLHANKRQIASSESQLDKQIAESRRLATEERQYQSRPIIVPKKQIIQTTPTYYNMNTGHAEGERLQTSDQGINWAYNHTIRIPLLNMGNGPAFNLHAVLYGPQASSHSQFVSWDNEPVEAKGPLDINLVHSTEFRLLHDESVDGKHPLYDRTPDPSAHSEEYQIACLTLTYHDLFGKKHVSIYHYTMQYQWIHVATSEISGEGSFDLKELNDRKKQGLKLSATHS
jgi:hypothetical protein